MAKSLLELSREGSTPIVSESDQPKPKEQGLSKLENRGKAIREKEFTIFARIMNLKTLIAVRFKNSILFLLNKQKRMRVKVLFVYVRLLPVMVVLVTN